MQFLTVIDNYFPHVWGMDVTPFLRRLKNVKTRTWLICLMAMVQIAGILFNMFWAKNGKSPSKLKWMNFYVAAAYLMLLLVERSHRCEATGGRLTKADSIMAASAGFQLLWRIWEGLVGDSHSVFPCLISLCAALGLLIDNEKVFLLDCPQHGEVVLEVVAEDSKTITLHCPVCGDGPA